MFVRRSLTRLGRHCGNATQLSPVVALLQAIETHIRGSGTHTANGTSRPDVALSDLAPEDGVDDSMASRHPLMDNPLIQQAFEVYSAAEKRRKGKSVEDGDIVPSPGVGPSRLVGESSQDATNAPATPNPQTPLPMLMSLLRRRRQLRETSV